jgi:hypothetical protein
MPGSTSREEGKKGKRRKADHEVNYHCECLVNGEESSEMVEHM